MKNLIGILILCISLTSFDIGSGTAYLKCKSDSGRTEFYAELQDIEGLLEKAILKIDESELEYKTDEGHIIFDPKNGVLTMYINDLENKEEHLYHKYIQFWSIPSTFKILKDEGHHQIYEFKAKIYGTEPRKEKEPNTPIITLNCRLEYEI